MIGGAVVGVAGLALTAARGFMGEGGASVALHGYLVGFAYWFGLALASLVLLGIWHAAKAKWVVAIRRPVEIFASTVPIFALLFVPIALGMKILYPWARSAEQIAAMPIEHQHVLHHREHWLNPSTFIARTVFYFIVWIVMSQVLTGSSFKQDKTGDPKLTERMWKWGPAGLPFLGVTLAFAAFDWLMSLETMWFSSMWGVYFFAGSFVALFALLLLVLRALSSDPSFTGAMRVTHWLATGQFLLAFTAFWGYIAFDQYMLTFVANLPDSTPFLIARNNGDWLYVSLALGAGHFIVPFFLLLSRARKTDPNRIAKVAVWILIVHFLDVYWMIIPQTSPGEISLSSTLTALSAFFGVGGVTVAFALYRFQGMSALPVKDPFLAESLAYKTVTAGTSFMTDPPVEASGQ